MKNGKMVKVALLLDVYGRVLSEKQRDALDFYYNEDMSLSEVGEALGMTRQGVREALMRGEEKLFFFEERLKAAEKFEAYDDGMKRIAAFLENGDSEAALKTAKSFIAE